MEAVNETLKLVAQAKESISIFLNQYKNDIEDEQDLKDGIILLDRAMEKLTEPGST